jgi:small subunit ribosomal protein S16
VQVKIRLQRFGSKKRPFYRIVTAANSEKRDGKFLDIVGLYHPISAVGSQVRLNEEKIKFWLEKGATPTETVKDILSKGGLWKAYSANKENARVAIVKRKNAAKKAGGKNTSAKTANVATAVEPVAETVIAETPAAE